MRNKDLRGLCCLVKAQVLWHLEWLAYLDGYDDVGRTVDKSTRDKVPAFRQSAVGPQAGRYVTRAKRVDWWPRGRGIAYVRERGPWSESAGRSVPGWPARTPGRTGGIKMRSSAHRIQRYARVRSTGWS